MCFWMIISKSNRECYKNIFIVIYSISEGCTLKLVLAMRGGPINTRRGRCLCSYKITIFMQHLPTVNSFS